MAGDQYQKEQKDFREKFSRLKGKAIALYGIGRRTMTLLPAIRDFHVIALLDRAKESIGKEINGIPICALDEVNRIADIIIINSDPSNFRVIYERIANDVEIPVYYANGERAARRETSYATNPYWGKTLQDLQMAIDAHDIVSFDFFDTLVTRKAMTPTDAFAILGDRVEREFHLGIDFATLRQTIAASCSPFATLDELYEEIVNRTGMSPEVAWHIKELELSLEAELTVARIPVEEAFRRAIQMGKQVFITSDTYVSSKQFYQLLSHHALDILPEKQVLLSSEFQKSKADGELFALLRATYPDARILHIGDNRKSDIEQARKHEIDAFYLMSSSDMLKASSVGRVVAVAKNWRDDIRLGLSTARLFQNPFVLHDTRGKVPFRDAETFGYAVFGGVMLRFCEWLAARAKTRRLRTLLFFARDGYFLERDFRYFLRLRETLPDIHTKFVPISRQLIYLATMHTEADYRRVASFAFLGSFRDYLFQRFNLKVDEADAHASEDVHTDEDDTLLKWLQPYESRIWTEQKRQERNYRRYLSGILGNLEQPAGIVDFSFYGTTQYYFQRFVKMELPGFYFLADLSEQNPYRQVNDMEACFQSDSDPKATACVLRKKGNFLESFLTAPYGMIRLIDDDGNMVTEPDRENQKQFAIKERVNEGICEYMADAVKILPMDSESGADGVEAAAYYAFLDGGAQISSDILKGFYFDNDMVGSKEVPLEV